MTLFQCWTYQYIVHLQGPTEEFLVLFFGKGTGFKANFVNVPAVFEGVSFASEGIYFCFDSVGFRNKFRKITFAIIHNDGEDGKYAPFYRLFNN